MIRLENISKSYADKKVLENINIEICKGQRLVILGKSGSGKTTLLNIIASIDSDYEGNVYLFDKCLKKLNNAKLSKIRRDDLGFIFQDFGLLENFTLEENILLPLRSAGMDIKKDEYFDRLMDVLDIGELLAKYPSELSGGEKQRAAIARAIIKKPKLVIADEITSALDIKTSRELMAYLDEAVRQFHITLLMVTHDFTAAKMCDQIYFLRNRKLRKLGSLKDAEALFFEDEEAK